MNQSRVTEWVRKVFTEAEATNAPERSLRVVEEAIELAQACGIDAEALHRMVDYVCGRPIGEAPKEIAGCLVTVYAAAAALGVDAQEELEIELSRIHRPEVIDRVRRRQKEKREALVAFDPVVQPIEDLPGARASSGLEGPKRMSARPAGRDDPVCGWAQCENIAVTSKGGVASLRRACRCEGLSRLRLRSTVDTSERMVRKRVRGEVRQRSVSRPKSRGHHSPRLLVLRRETRNGALCRRHNTRGVVRQDRGPRSDVWAGTGVVWNGRGNRAVGERGLSRQAHLGTAMTSDPYEICRHIRRYHQKNSYAPKRAEVEHWCDGAEFFEKLVENGVIEVLPIAEHGPPVAVVLTEKGFRMAMLERRR